MSPRPPLPSVWRTIRWPLLISLLVVVARLVGELQGWDPRFFSTEAGGGVAVVGVAWLMPVFGFVFGWILTGKGRAPDRPGLAIILNLLGMGALVSGIALLVPLVDPPISYAVLGGTALVALLFGWRAWTQLLRYTLVYGLLVRIGVVVVTLVAFAAEWGTHFEKVPPSLADRPRSEQMLALCAAQLLIWVPSTVLIGGVFGAVASMIRGRRPDDAPDE